MELIKPLCSGHPGKFLLTLQPTKRPQHEGSSTRRWLRRTLRMSLDFSCSATPACSPGVSWSWALLTLVIWSILG